MVLGVPLAKLAALTFKIVMKPAVDSLKKSVQKSLFWKDSVFIPLAEYYNKQSITFRLWTQGIRRNKEQIEQSSHMSEEAALELGAEIVANTATFGIGILAIIMQQSISAAQEHKKEERALEQMEKKQLELYKKIFDMSIEMQRHNVKLQEVQRTLTLMSEYGQKSTLHQRSKNVNQHKS